MVVVMLAVKINASREYNTTAASTVREYPFHRLLAARMELFAAIRVIGGDGSNF